MMPEEDGSTNSAIPAGMKKTLSCLGQDDVQLEPSALSANTEVLQKERVVDLDETQSSLSDLMDVDELYASPTPKLTAAGQAMEDTNDKRVADSLESQVPEASTQRSTQGQEVRRMQKGLQKMVCLCSPKPFTLIDADRHRSSNIPQHHKVLKKHSCLTRNASTPRPIMNFRSVLCSPSFLHAN